MHYVIIGNGVAGIEAALTIRARFAPSDASITVISKETDYFFSRTALMYAYMNAMNRRDLEPYEREVWETQSIELIRDEVVDLDAHARTISLTKGGDLPFDRLLLAVGSAPRHVPFEGIDDATSGVVHFVSMPDLDACESLTPSTSHAVVVGGGLIGIELVECLLYHGVEVTFLVREPTYWSAALSGAEGEIIAAHIRDHGVDLRLEEELDRVLVDETKRVCGIVTKSGEEIRCQMLGICVGVVSASSWLRDVSTPPRIERGILVDRAFRTSLDEVWAAGDCVEIEPREDEEGSIIETIWYSAKRHGRLAALSMMGDHVEYTPPIFFNSSKFFEIEYTTVGDVAQAPDDARVLWCTYRDEEKLSQRIAFLPEEDRRVIGFNMLGSRWNHRLFERWIKERRSIEYVMTHLNTAQFDVEFGRAPLEKMQREEVAP